MKSLDEEDDEVGADVLLVARGDGLLVAAG